MTDKNYLLKKTLFEKILPFVSHPTRYIGHEQNIFLPEPAAEKVRILLAFPEAYEVGMSYLGFKILYGLINSSTGAVAERVFSPWPDMEAKLKEHGLPLYSLESYTPVKDFDIIGFTLQYEMTYTNILQILDLGKVPLLAKDRGETDPLVLGGGPVAYNPEPVADFFDLFLIGEGEEAVEEIIAVCKAAKKAGLKRAEILEKLSGLAGIYVPSYYSPVYNPDKTFKSLSVLKDKAPLSIKKRVVLDFEKAYVPLKPIVPYMNIIQNRVTVEILRGCTHGCRFCISGITTRPVRERSVMGILGIAKESQEATGFDEISLTSLSSTDHSKIKEIIRGLSSSFLGEGISVALPSSRIDAFSVELAAGLNSVRKSTLTFAPEAGTQRLRNVINKCVTEKDLLDACTTAVKSGLDNIKLYFMLDLPTETEQDIIGIAELVKKVQAACKQADKKFRGLNVSISFMIPKAHTPFMWEAQALQSQIKSKIDLLRKNINPRLLKWHSLELTLLEGAFARGDRTLSAVILNAYGRGARFDAWRENFKPELWEQAFKETGLDPLFYTARKRPLDEKFPWDHIDCLVTKEFLKKELEKALKAESSEDCRKTGCVFCGAEEFCEKIKKQDEAGPVPGPALPLPPVKRFPVAKYRINYEKTEAIKFISHLELANALLRSIIRSGLPLARTEGFNPHPKVAFSPALPVGVSSSCEVFDLELTRSLNEKEVFESVLKTLPPGIKLLSAARVDLTMDLQYSEAVYEVVLNAPLTFNPELKPEAVSKVEQNGDKFMLYVDLKAKGTTSVFKLLMALTGLPDTVIKGALINRSSLK